MVEEEETRVQELWFSNDTLVIRAEKKLFRVSRSLLAARSTVFQDMGAFPQPASDESELIDGSPVVTLHDSAADVEALLKAIFDSSYFMPPPEVVQLDAVLGILRLSHKYDIRYLHRRALNHLSCQYFATSVEEYRSTRSDSISVRGNVTLAVLSIIKAATELGAPQDIVQRCLLSYTDFVLGSAAVFHSISVSAGCESSPACNSARLRILLIFFDTAADEKLGLLPLEIFGEASWDAIRRSLCGACYTLSKEKRRKSLEAFWERLPGIYGLPGWPELRAMRNAAMGDDT
ncbi:hypothetical protein DFH09DRAFT_1152450 [Mycena vulgaris]|nr:hypothetical protein DFH09DRAFT_1152450 [Mycena vulgaris]